MEELRRRIKRLKRKKACGPDEIPMEMMKERDDNGLEQIHEMLRKFQNNETTPTEETRARVATISKKKEAIAKQETTDPYHY